jgi:O-antigen/teichoic acid export membrane protein
LNEGSSQQLARRAGSLREIAAGGVAWTSSAMVVTTVVQFGQIAVLARILDPGDFGLIALSLIVVNFGVAFSDMGLSYVLIARQLRSPNVLSSLYWTNVIAGGLVACAVLALAPLLADFFNAPGLRPLLHWTALIFLLTAVGQQFHVLLQRDLRFGVIARAESFAAVAGAAAAVSLAVAGAGAKSFVIGFALKEGMRSAWMIAAARPWRPHLRLRFHEIREHLGFGAYTTGNLLAHFGAQDIDYIIVGRVLGPAVLGPYMLGYQVTMAPMRRVYPVLSRVALPMFAMPESDDERVGRGYAELLKMLALTILPALALVGGLAPVLVPTLFGDGWEITVAVLPALALAGAIRTLNDPAGTVFIAKDRPDLGFKINAATLVALTVAIFGAAQIGIEAVAWAYAGVVAVYMVVVAYMIRRLIGLPLARQATAVAPGLTVAAVGFLTAVAALAVSDPGWSDPTTLAIAAPVALITALALALALEGAYLVAQVRLLLGRTREAR